MANELIHFSLEIHDIKWNASETDIIKHHLPNYLKATIVAEDVGKLILNATYRFLKDSFGFEAKDLYITNITTLDDDDTDTLTGESCEAMIPSDGSNTPTSNAQKYAIIYEGVNVNEEDEKCFIVPNLKMAVDTMHSMVMNFLSTIPYDIDVSFRYQKKNPTCVINDREYMWRCISVSD